MLQDMNNTWTVGLGDDVADAFKGYGGTVLRTMLGKEQQAKVEATLQGR
jgi:hypothetical protein